MFEGCVNVDVAEGVWVGVGVVVVIVNWYRIDVSVQHL